MIFLFLPVSQGEIPAYRASMPSAYRLAGEATKYTGSRDRGNSCLRLVPRMLLESIVGCRLRR